MLLSEPPPTQADLHFRLLGFPVRVHPFFWVVALLLTFRGEKVEPLSALLWVAVVFVSILAHELGHAVMQRRYGGHPWITLHGLGGLSACDDCDRSARSQIIISLSGPVAGFLLALAVMLLVGTAGHRVGLAFRPQLADVESILEAGNLLLPMPLFAVYFEPFASRPTTLLIVNLLWVNILWGLLNLLPIYPLDGGRIARELFALGDPRRGIIQSLWLSIAAAVLVAILGLRVGSLLMTLLFGYIAYTNYQTLRAYEQHWQ